MKKKKTLKEIRKQLGLTQKEMAKELNYKGRDSIAKKESGSNSLTIHDLRILSEKFGIDLNELDI